MKIISTFAGEHRFLSNFWPSPIRWEGDDFATVEHGYQAYKVADRESAAFHQIRTAATPGQAKRLTRLLRFDPAPDFHRWKVDHMRDLLGEKFAAGSALAARLLATGDAQLREGNTWGDEFWGVNARTGVGQNMLGQVLMDQRQFLIDGVPRWLKELKAPAGAA